MQHLDSPTNHAHVSAMPRIEALVIYAVSPLHSISRCSSDYGPLKPIDHQGKMSRYPQVRRTQPSLGTWLSMSPNLRWLLSSADTRSDTNHQPVPGTGRSSSRFADQVYKNHQGQRRPAKGIWLHRIRCSRWLEGCLGEERTEFR